MLQLKFSISIFILEVYFFNTNHDIFIFMLKGVPELKVMEKTNIQNSKSQEPIVRQQLVRKGSGGSNGIQNYFLFQPRL